MPRNSFKSVTGRPSPMAKTARPRRGALGRKRRAYRRAGTRRQRQRLRPGAGAIIKTLSLEGRSASPTRWRGAGAVERVGLENRSTGNCTVGSNPTLSDSQGPDHVAKVISGSRVPHESNANQGPPLLQWGGGCRRKATGLLEALGSGVHCLSQYRKPRMCARIRRRSGADLRDRI